MGFQAGRRQCCHELLHGRAWRWLIELAVEPEPDLTLVHCGFEAQVHIPTGAGGRIDCLRQMQSAGWIVRHELFDVPHKLASVTGVDQRAIVPRWRRQWLPAVAQITLRYWLEPGKVPVITPPGR